MARAELAIGLEADVTHHRALEAAAADAFGDRRAVQRLQLVGRHRPHLQRSRPQRHEFVGRVLVHLQALGHKALVGRVGRKGLHRREVNVGPDQAVGGITGHLDHAGGHRAHGRDKTALQPGLARLPDGGRHAQAFIGIDGHGQLGVGGPHIGHRHPEVGLRERKFLLGHLLVGPVQALEFTLDRGLRAIAVCVVLGQEGDAPGLGDVGDVAGDHCAVLRVRAVQAHRHRVALARQDGVGLGDGGDVENPCARQHRLHRQRDRAVPALDDHRHAGRGQLGGARYAYGRRRFVIARDDLDLAAQHATGVVDHRRHHVDGVGHVLALGPGTARQRQDHADLHRGLGRGRQRQAQRAGRKQGTNQLHRCVSCLLVTRPWPGAVLRTKAERRQSGAPCAACCAESTCGLGMSKGSQSQYHPVCAGVNAGSTALSRKRCLASRCVPPRPEPASIASVPGGMRRSGQVTPQGGGAA